MITILSLAVDYEAWEIIVKNDSGDILRCYRYSSVEEVDQVVGPLREIVRMNNVLRERWDEVVEIPYS